MGEVVFCFGRWGGKNGPGAEISPRSSGNTGRNCRRIINPEHPAYHRHHRLACGGYGGVAWPRYRYSRGHRWHPRSRGGWQKWPVAAARGRGRPKQARRSRRGGGQGQDARFFQPHAGVGDDAEIVIGELEIIFRIHAIAIEMGVLRELAILLQHLRSIAPRPAIDTIGLLATTTTATALRTAIAARTPTVVVVVVVATIIVVQGSSLP